MPDPYTKDARVERIGQISEIAAMRQQPIVDLLHENDQTLVDQLLPLNFIHANVTADFLPLLEAREDVLFIESLNAVFSLSLLESRQITGIEQTKYRGYDGSNTIIGIIDSGLDIEPGSYDPGSHTATPAHDDLDDLDYIRDTGKAKLNRIMDMTGGNNPDDCHGHGTQVAGIATGTGAVQQAYSGYAPNAKLNVYKVLDDCPGGINSNITNPNTLNAIRVKAITAAIKEATNDEVDVINLSLGGWVIHDGMRMAINRAYDMGISIVTSTGNHGRDSPPFISDPGTYHKVLSVGATSQDKTNLRMPYSGYGGTNDGRIKPDLTAPVDTIHPIYGGMVAPTNVTDTYATDLYGTSFAAPQVSGAIADLIEKYDRNGVTLTPGMLYAIMLSQATGTATSDDGLRMDNQIGAGTLGMRYNNIKTVSSFVGVGKALASTTFLIDVPRGNREVHHGPVVARG